MFVRKKRNRTGTISVVVVDKSHGGFKEVKNFGVVSSEEEADILYMRAREWISTYAGQQVMDFGRNVVQERELEDAERASARPGHPRKTLIMVTHYEEELPDCMSHRLTLTKPEA